MIARILYERITQRLFRGKAIIILGPRQVGKTTLVKKIMNELGESYIYLNGDEPDVPGLLENKNSLSLRNIIGKKRLLVIDEAQRVKNIGLIVKLLIDNYPDIQVIVTGSSSLELANETQEPLTGRKYEYNLFPLSYQELESHEGILETRRQLEHRLIYGFYPEIITSPGEEEELLKLITGSYLYKDVFALQNIRRPELFQRILQALALQIGNEVSYHELGQLVGADNQTVERYIDLLEKSFVIFRLGAFSRNLRNELKRSRKIYFWDNGIRNALISNFNSLHLRQDTGALWENFLICERLKVNHYLNKSVNTYFWRTRTQQEIDYIEERGGSLSAYEMKWNPKKRKKIPLSFTNAYPNSEAWIINLDNFRDFVIGL